MYRQNPYLPPGVTDEMIDREAGFDDGDEDEDNEDNDED